jgi:hypothetical protein
MGGVGAQFGAFGGGWFGGGGGASIAGSGGGGSSYGGGGPSSGISIATASPSDAPEVMISYRLPLPTSTVVEPPAARRSVASAGCSAAAAS